MKKLFKEWDAITVKFLAFVIVIAGAVITLSIYIAYLNSLNLCFKIWLFHNSFYIFVLLKNRLNNGKAKNTP
jgi:hypothetical protein